MSTRTGSLMKTYLIYTSHSTDHMHIDVPHISIKSPEIVNVFVCLMIFPSREFANLPQEDMDTELHVATANLSHTKIGLTYDYNRTNQEIVNEYIGPTDENNCSS